MPSAPAVLITRVTFPDLAARLGQLCAVEARRIPRFAGGQPVRGAGSSVGRA